jgi:hypothetical protein
MHGSKISDIMKGFIWRVDEMYIENSTKVLKVPNFPPLLKNQPLIVLYYQCFPQHT